MVSQELLLVMRLIEEKRLAQVLKSGATREMGIRWVEGGGEGACVVVWERARGG